MNALRLQKLLAQAGVASRRAAERLIVEGRVRVNGRAVTQLGARVDPLRDRVEVDGQPVRLQPRRPRYFILHKPRGVLTTLRDPGHRPTIRDLIRHIPERVYPVGRLDYHSEGLVLLTNDGELAFALTHPSRRVARVYRVLVRGRPSPEALDALRRGIPLEGRRTLPARVRRLHSGRNTWLEITLREGRRQQIRRMCLAIGHPVKRLRRVSYGGVGLGDLPAGAVRALRIEEIARLREAAGLGGEASRGRSGSRQALERR